MSILHQLHDFNYLALDTDSDEILTAAKQSAIVNLAKQAVNRAYRYYGIGREQQTGLWDEIVQEALVGVYSALGQTVRAAYRSAVWSAMRFLHLQANNPDGLYGVARIHESYEQMTDTMAGGAYSWTPTTLKRPTESQALYNLTRETTRWEESRHYWETLQAQSVMELATALYDASSPDDDIWTKVHGDLFGAFCQMREAHQLKPLSIYTHIIVQRSRGVTHEEICAGLEIDDPIQYLNALNRAFQALEELAALTPEERTARMQANHGLILHYSQLEQDMRPLLDTKHRKHIIIFPFGALSLTKPLTKGAQPQRVGKFEMQYFTGGDWQTGRRRKVSVTTPPLATLTYGQLRESALRFIDRVRTAGGDGIAREFFGPAVLHALLNG